MAKNLKGSEDQANAEQPESFEKSFAHIEAVVRQLEQGTAGLDESLALYQSAVQHLRFCHAKLADAQRQVEILQQVNADGSAITDEFEDDAASLEEKATKRSSRRSATQKRLLSEDD